MAEFAYRIEEGDGSLLDVIGPFWEKLRDHHVQLDTPFSADTAARSFTMRKNDLTSKTASLNDIHVLLAKDTQTQTVLGYLVVSVEPNGRGELDSLYVSEGARGQGIGRELFTRGLEWLQQRNATPIQLAVMAGNEPVMALYQKFGFQPRNVLMEWLDSADGEA